MSGITGDSLCQLASQPGRNLQQLDPLKLSLLIISDFLKLLITSNNDHQLLEQELQGGQLKGLTSIARSIRAMSDRTSRASSCWTERGPLHSRRRGI